MIILKICKQSILLHKKYIKHQFQTILRIFLKGDTHMVEKGKQTKIRDLKWPRLKYTSKFNFSIF